MTITKHETDLKYLLDLIATDRQLAEAAQPGPWRAQGWGQAMLPTPWKRGPHWEDNAVAAATGATIGQQGNADAAHIARHNPARVLAECKAKMRVVKELQRAEHAAEADPDDRTARCALNSLRIVVWALARTHEDHPDNKDERPATERSQGANVAAVRALHQKGFTLIAGDICTHCERLWPCPTIVALGSGK